MSTVVHLKDPVTFPTQNGHKTMWMVLILQVLMLELYKLVLMTFCGWFQTFWFLFFAFYSTKLLISGNKGNLPNTCMTLVIFDVPKSMSTLGLHKLHTVL